MKCREKNGKKSEMKGEEKREDKNRKFSTKRENANGDKIEIKINVFQCATLTFK